MTKGECLIGVHTKNVLYLSILTTQHETRQGCVKRLLMMVKARKMHIKGNAQFIQKVTFEPLMDFKQNHYGSWKYYKNCYF